MQQQQQQQQLYEDLTPTQSMTPAWASLDMEDGGAILAEFVPPHRAALSLPGLDFWDDMLAELRRQMIDVLVDEHRDGNVEATTALCMLRLTSKANYDAVPTPLKMTSAQVERAIYSGHEELLLTLLACSPPKKDKLLGRVAYWLGDSGFWLHWIPQGDASAFLRALDCDHDEFAAKTLLPASLGAIRGNHGSLFKELFQRRLDFVGALELLAVSFMLEECVRYGRVSWVEWLSMHGHGSECWNPELCLLAVTHGHGDMLEWLLDNGCPWDPERCLYAAQNRGDDNLLAIISARFAR